MTRIFVIFFLVFFIGCAKQPPKPLYIDIKSNGILQIGTDIYDNATLRELLKKRLGSEGRSIPIYCIAEKDTPFSRVKSVMLAVVDAGGYALYFKIKGAEKTEQSPCYAAEADGVKKLTGINAEIKNNELYIDSRKMSIEEFKKLIKSKPSDTYGYRGILLC